MNDSIIKAEEYPDVVFMENSITEDWYNMHPDFFKQNNIAGSRISAQSTPQMMIRFRPDVIDLKLKTVVILAGTNDIAGNTDFASVKMITDNIKVRAELARQNNIKVILSSILPVYDYPWRPSLESVSKIAGVNSWRRKFAKENGFTYFDYLPALVNEKKGIKRICQLLRTSHLCWI